MQCESLENSVCGTGLAVLWVSRVVAVMILRPLVGMGGLRVRARGGIEGGCRGRLLALARSSLVSATAEQRARRCEAFITLAGGLRLLLAHVGSPHGTGCLQMSFAGCIKSLLSSNLLLPHRCVAALLCQEIIMSTLLDNGSLVENNDLVSVGNGGQPVPASRISIISIPSRVLGRGSA